MPEDAPPAEFSDDEEDGEDDPAKAALNKQALLEWLTVADFTGEMSLTNISNHKFKLDEAELTAMISTEGILKICKVYVPYHYHHPSLSHVVPLGSFTRLV